MTVESATVISDLNATYPAAGDSLVEGDDHLRLLKTVIKDTFPGVTGIVLPTHTELNFVDGVTSDIQTQINALGGTLLQTQTAAATQFINFTTGISATYNFYELHIINAVPDTANTTLFLRTSADGGSTWDSASGDYDWTYQQGLVTTSTVANGSTTATDIRLCAAIVDTSAAFGGICAVVKIYNPAGTASYKRMTWQGSASDSTTKGNLATFHGGGARASTAAINGIRVQSSTGSITSGVFKLYGFRV